MRFSNWRNLERWPFIGLLLLLMIVAAGGGSSRDNVDSLIYVRPFGALLLGLGLLTVQKRHLGAHTFAFAASGVAIAITAIHLLPLPPSIWQSLPGRALFAEADSAVGLDGIWRPVSLVPWRTWNALFALIIPTAALVLASQLRRHENLLLVPILIALAVSSGLLSLLQVIGSANSSLYLYDVTTEGAAVGLFANRNHQAVLMGMLLPLAASYSAFNVPTLERWRRRIFISIASIAIMAPLLVVSRSRAAFAVAIIGVIAGYFIYHRPTITRPPRRKRQQARARWIPVAAVASAFLTMAFLAGRATTFEKLFQSDPIDTTRQTIWATTIEGIIAYFPVGAGIGTFGDSYRVFERPEDLRVEYINHAHNDFLELLFTAGLPGALLIAVVLFGFVYAAWRLFNRSAIRAENRDSVILGRVGIALLLQLGASSLVDYPTRTPTMSVIVVIATVWILGALRALHPNYSPNVRNEHGFGPGDVNQSS